MFPLDLLFIGFLSIVLLPAYMT